jgi:predicted porin
MKTRLKSLVGSAALGLACGPCLAQSQVQIYGTFDAAVGQIETQPPGAPTAAIVRVRGVHSGALQTSYIGFRGTEDLGGGLRARFQIESFFRGDTGQVGRFDASPTSGADAFWSREAYVAVGGGFGEVRLGNNGNPLWVTMLQTNALGSNSVFSPAFRQMFNGGARGRSEVDTSMVNSIKYVSPSWAGFSFDAVLQAGEGSGARYNQAYSLSYRAGPLLLGLATQDLRHAAVPNLAGARNQTMTLGGGAYDFGMLRVFAQYTGIDNKRLATKDKLPHFGLTVPLGNGVLQLATGQDKTTGATAAASAMRRTTSGGYVYNLSRRSQLYTFVMSDKLAVGTAKSYVAGVRHAF